jgi:putative membrane protein
MMGGGWLWMILMAVIWLLFTAGIVLIIIWIVNRARTPVAGREETALDILNKRFARGELNLEGYERMKQDL